ncbi:MAG: alpha/beta fold hydrolase [Saprospiraceae bacterium]
MKTKLLLLHGALGSKKQFEPLKDLLSGSFEVYDLNFEGHGGRATDKKFSIELFSENVVQFMDENKIEKINIFGYSMGGYVALKTAINYPARIGKIITLGTKFKWDEASTLKEVGMLNPVTIEEKVPHFAAKLKDEHEPLDWKEVVKKTAEMMRGLADGKAIKDESIAAIIQSVTIGLGSEDRMVSISESEQTANLLPNGKFMVLHGEPHPFEKVNTDQLCAWIRELFT